MIAMLAAVSSANAQDDMVDPVQESVDSVMLDCCCCDSSSWYAGAEAVLFRFHEANGVQSADLLDASFDYEVQPRVTVGYESCDGMGARVRYWRYDDTEIAPGPDPIEVDTYTIDLELYQKLDLCPCTTLEVFGGVRYNDFFFFRDDGGVADDMHRFRGFGGIVGVNATRSLGNHLSAYGGLRQIIMSGDADFNGANNNEQDTIRPVTEISLGVRYDNCNWWLNVGYEWQNWANYVETAGLFNADNETSDIGFVGFVIGGGISY